MLRLMLADAHHRLHGAHPKRAQDGRSFAASMMPNGRTASRARYRRVVLEAGPGGTGRAGLAGTRCVAEVTGSIGGRNVPVAPVRYDDERRAM
jgi:hypothetical protein